jgi:hypothetical protein
MSKSGSALSMTSNSTSSSGPQQLSGAKVRQKHAKPALRETASTVTFSEEVAPFSGLQSPSTKEEGGGQGDGGEGTDKRQLKLQEMELKEVDVQNQFNHFSIEQQRIDRLKEQERRLGERDRSRNVERKRRLLSEEEGRRRGPPPEDPSNVFDYYAVRIQALIRGFVARAYSRWFRRVSGPAILVLQAAVRGMLGRVRSRNMRNRFKAAVDIQRVFRGWSSRVSRQALLSRRLRLMIHLFLCSKGSSAAFAAQAERNKAATQIQRMYRGRLGRARLASKKLLDEAARVAYEVVDSNSLLVADVKELARRIIYAIEVHTMRITAH